MNNKEYSQLFEVCHRERINASIVSILSEIRSGKTFDEIVNKLHTLVR